MFTIASQKTGSGPVGNMSLILHFLEFCLSSSLISVFSLVLAVFICICLCFFLFTSCLGVFGFLFVYFLCLFFVAQAGLPACLPLVGLDGWGSTLLYTSLLYLFNFVFVFIRICTYTSYLCDLFDVFVGL